MFLTQRLAQRYELTEAHLSNTRVNGMHSTVWRIKWITVLLYSLPHGLLVRYVRGKPAVTKIKGNNP